MNIKRAFVLQTCALSFFIAGAHPQFGNQVQENAMKIKRRTSSGAVLKDRGTAFNMPTPKGKPGNFTPQLALLGAEAININGKPGSWVSFTIENWKLFPTDLFKPAPALPPCGKNSNSARTWLAIYNSDTNAYIYGYCALESPAALKDFGYAIPDTKPLPKQVYVVLTDRQTNTVYQSNCINAWSGVACGKS